MPLVMKPWANDRTMLGVSQIIVLLAVARICSADFNFLDTESQEKAIADKFLDSVSRNTILQETLYQSEADVMPTDMAHLIAEFTAIAELAHKMERDKVLPQDEIKEQYLKMAHFLEDILEHMSYANNAYNFLQAKGLDIIIAPNLKITFPQIRTKLLQILKTLFDVVPTTTLSLIPDTILDSILDIYEQDDDIGIKINAMELLSVWLPGNPRAQTRVMKMKGLVPFYKQLEKFEPLLTKLTLELFSTILNEHITVRNKKLQKNKADYATFQLYQQMALIERLSTPMLCNGLVKIFEGLFSTGPPSKEVMPPMLKVLDFIKPHCARIYSGRTKVITLIAQMLHQCQDPIFQIEMEARGVNLTEAIKSLTEFAELIKADHTDL